MYFNHVEAAVLNRDYCNITNSYTVVITFLKAEAGAISAPLSVLRRNIGHDEAFILKPKHTVRFIQSQSQAGSISRIFLGQLWLYI